MFHHSPSLKQLATLLCFFLAPHSALQAGESFFSSEIASGQRFLTNLFDPDLDLLPEYRGAKVYWLYHDNYLAAKMLKFSRPDLATRIENAMHRFGVSASGKIEILFHEAHNAFPFHTYELLDVTNIAGKIIRAEHVTAKPLKGWETYADLLLMAAIAKEKAAPDEANAYFKKALALWDGRGFADPAFQKGHLYATYKLALAIIVADSLKQELPFRSQALEQLRKLQVPAGGWITDYDREGTPRGFANVETTCFALIALRHH